tara:strand:- start:56 stop:337 length:282 start_codon:yes stop_codon:yes gene_type:complete
MGESQKSEKKLKILKENRINFLQEKLDNEIKGYDHLLHLNKDNTLIVNESTKNRVDENIRIILVKYNDQIRKVEKMRIKDFSSEERLTADKQL